MFGKRIYQRLINTSDIEPGSSEPPPKVGKQPQFQPDGLIRVGTGLEWHHFRRSGGNQSGVDYGFEHTNTPVAGRVPDWGFQRVRSNHAYILPRRLQDREK